MASNRKVMVLPGDGIGNEVMQANMKIIDWLAKHRSLGFDLSEGLDDIGLTLAKADDIDSYEAKREKDQPWL